MVAVPTVIIMFVPPIKVAMFPANVLAVNPMMPEARDMPRNPVHFITAVPVTFAMAVKRTVADLNLNAIGPNGRRDQKTRSDDGRE